MGLIFASRYKQSEGRNQDEIQIVWYTFIRFAMGTEANQIIGDGGNR